MFTYGPTTILNASVNFFEEGNSVWGT
jgi:hypothetical protein